jgi:hypothetical protein
MVLCVLVLVPVEESQLAVAAAKEAGGKEREAVTKPVVARKVLPPVAAFE